MWHDSRWLTHGGIVIAILLTITVLYFPGVHGPFVLDDGENITLNKAIAINGLGMNELVGALLANESGILRRPFASLTFALNAYFAGGVNNPVMFKLTNIGIHGINAILAYLLTLKLFVTPRLRERVLKLNTPVIAALVALIWATHPIQLTSVLYVVQRMTSLSALFMLCGLLGFVHGRLRYEMGYPGGMWFAAISVVLSTALGLSAKENAILLPFLAAVLEYTLFSRETLSAGKRNGLRTFYFATVLLPLILGIAYVAWNPGFITNSYLGRDFTIWERLLTEARILWFYLGLILLPTNHRLSLFHDDIGLSTGLLMPMTTLLAVVGIFAALGLALTRSRRNPVISFAILWFLAGHVLESGVFGLELAYEHRNYLPSYGILFAFAVGLMTLAKNRGPAYLFAPVVVCLALGFSTWARANTWRNIETLAEHTAQTHPDSARANDFAARVSLDKKNDIAAAIRYTLRGLKVAPNEVGFQLDLQMLFSALATEVERSLTKPSKQSPGNSFTLRLPGLEDDIQATLTKRGLRLSHNDSSSEAILALLQTQPVTVHGVVSLENLRHCLLEPPKRCAVLKDAALGWFAAAAANTRTAAEYRAILASDAAMLYADAGNVARALDYMTRAATLLPNHVPYRAATAEYLIRLGRLDEAKHTIEKISTEPAPTDIQAAKRDLNLHKLKELYNEAIEKNSHKPSQ